MSELTIILLLKNIFAFIFWIFTLLFLPPDGKKKGPYFRENESSAHRLRLHSTVPDPHKIYAPADSLCKIGNVSGAPKRTVR